MNNKNETAQQRRVRNREYIQSRMTPCEDCGFFHPAAMDFHHTGVKRKGISEAARCGYSIKFLKEEIDNCVCLCSNCHRIRHFSSAG